MKREFYFQDDRSNKFWTVEVVGNEVVTTNGRIGASPRELRKEFSDAAVAQREAEKLANSKLKSGYVEGAISAAPQYEKPNWSQMTMSEDVFWRIIGLFNWKKTGDDDEVLKPAVTALSVMSVEDIQRFNDILAEKLFALDTEAHAREVGEYAYREGEYFSGDGFLYSRCVVVANGRSLFEAVLNDPKQMPKDMDFEAILSLAGQAFEEQTGAEFEYDSPVSYESFSNKSGWQNVKFE